MSLLPGCSAQRAPSIYRSDDFDWWLNLAFHSNLTQVVKFPWHRGVETFNPLSWVCYSASDLLRGTRDALEDVSLVATSMKYHTFSSGSWNEMGYRFAISLCLIFDYIRESVSIPINFLTDLSLNSFRMQLIWDEHRCLCDDLRVKRVMSSTCSSNHEGIWSNVMVIMFLKELNSMFDDLILGLLISKMRCDRKSEYTQVESDTISCWVGESRNTKE